jgi:predicted DNA binding CopG/RHH family protein
MKTNPTIGKYIDEEERDLIESLEADDAVFKSHLTPTRKKQIEAMARATMNDEREKITLRISRSDLSRIKSKAMQEGMPYQTLINSILHKAVS